MVFVAITCVGAFHLAVQFKTHGLLRAQYSGNCHRVFEVNEYVLKRT